MIVNKRKICIVGTGGFGREVLCCLIDSLPPSDLPLHELVCFMVGDEYYSENRMMGLDVIPQSRFDPAYYDVVVAIGEPSLRKKMVESLPEETKFTNVIHPTAVISQWVELGEGSIVTAGTILTCNIKIGKHAHLNLHTTVGHDCVMGDYFTTAPAANISGYCVFGDCVYFGTNASVKQGIHITSHVTIGMGAVVVKDIQEEGVYLGNPLVKLEKKSFKD